MASNGERNGAKPKSLKNELAAALPEEFQCKVRYVHTAPKRCDAIFSPPSGSDPEPTRLASHFLTVSITIKSDADDRGTSDVFVLGIEALVYSTKHMDAIFVSKADSTGYLPQQRPSAAKAIITTFLSWLSSKQRLEHPNRKVMISLFARSQSQYLFPGSAENSKKHILDDRQLIKWWANVLDPLFPRQDNFIAAIDAQGSLYMAYVTVPGFDRTELRQFYPKSAHGNSNAIRWYAGDPLQDLAKAWGLSDDAPPRCLLPRFPDDPKARFMQDLDDEAGLAEDTLASLSKRKGGKWTTISNLDRFWEAMEFRQECSSGRMVGFLWLVIRPLSDIMAGSATQDSSQGALSSAPVSAPDVPPVSSGRSPSKRRRKPLSGPIIPRQPRLKGGSSSLTATLDLNGMLNTEPGDGLVLTPEGYDKAMQTLLHLDFSNIEAATKSTSKWVSEVAHICDVHSDWSLEIVGTAKPEVMASKDGSSGQTQVNDLGGMIKKKRKAEDQTVAQHHAVAEARVESAGEEKAAVNVLGGGMVRKKRKPAPS